MANPKVKDPEETASETEDIDRNNLSAQNVTAKVQHVDAKPPDLPAANQQTPELRKASLRLRTAPELALGNLTASKKARLTSTDVAPPTPLKIRHTILPGSSSEARVGLAPSAGLPPVPNPSVRHRLKPAPPKGGRSFLGSCFGGTLAPLSPKLPAPQIPPRRPTRSPVPIDHGKPRVAVPSSESDSGKKGLDFANKLALTVVADSNASSGAAPPVPRSPDCRCSISTETVDNKEPRPNELPTVGDTSMNKGESNDRGNSSGQQVLNAQAPDIIAAVQRAEASRQADTGVSPIRGLRPNRASELDPGNFKRPRKVSQDKDLGPEVQGGQISPEFKRLRKAQPDRVNVGPRAFKLLRKDGQGRDLGPEAQDRNIGPGTFKRLRKVGQGRDPGREAQHWKSNPGNFNRPRKFDIEVGRDPGPQAQTRGQYQVRPPSFTPHYVNRSRVYYNAGYNTAMSRSQPTTSKGVAKLFDAIIGRGESDYPEQEARQEKARSRSWSPIPKDYHRTQRTQKFNVPLAMNSRRAHRYAALRAKNDREQLQSYSPRPNPAETSSRDQGYADRISSPETSSRDQGYADRISSPETSSRDQGYADRISSPETSSRDQGYADRISSPETSGRDQGYADRISSPETSGRDQGYADRISSPETSGRDQGYSDRANSPESSTRDQEYDNADSLKTSSRDQGYFDRANSPDRSTPAPEEYSRANYSRAIPSETISRDDHANSPNTSTRIPQEYSVANHPETSSRDQGHSNHANSPETSTRDQAYYSVDPLQDQTSNTEQPVYESATYVDTRAALDISQERDTRLLASEFRWKRKDPFREVEERNRDPRRRGYPDPSFSPRPGDIIIRARKRASLRLTDFYYYDNENYMEQGDQILRAKFEYLPPMDTMYLWCRLYVYGADGGYTFLDSTSESVGKFRTGPDVQAKTFKEPARFL